MLHGGHQVLCARVNGVYFAVLGAGSEHLFGQPTETGETVEGVFLGADQFLAGDVHHSDAPAVVSHRHRHPLSGKFEGGIKAFGVVEQFDDVFILVLQFEKVDLFLEGDAEEVVGRPVQDGLVTSPGKSHLPVRGRLTFCTAAGIFCGSRQSSFPAPQRTGPVKKDWEAQGHTAGADWEKIRGVQP